MSAVSGDGGDEGIQLVFLLLQFLHQTLNGPFGEGLALAALPVTHQTVDDAQTGIVTGGRVCDGHPALIIRLGEAPGCRFELVSARHRRQ